MTLRPDIMIELLTDNTCQLQTRYVTFGSMSTGPVHHFIHLSLPKIHFHPLDRKVTKMRDAHSQHIFAATKEDERRADQSNGILTGTVMLAFSAHH